MDDAATLWLQKKVAGLSISSHLATRIRDLTALDLLALLHNEAFGNAFICASDCCLPGGESYSGIASAVLAQQENLLAIISQVEAPPADVEITPMLPADHMRLCNITTDLLLILIGQYFLRIRLDIRSKKASLNTARL